MVTIYYQTDSGFVSAELTKENRALLQKALWIDLLDPSLDDEKIVEEQLSISIPTKKEIEEIEPSSRLYTENGILYMTANMIALSDSPEANTDVVGFIFSPKYLITLRYYELHAFKLFSAKLLRTPLKHVDSRFILIELLEAIIDRLADILEKITQKYDDISKSIFHQSNKGTNYKNTLLQIGLNGDLGTKATESIMSFIRVISYFEQTLEVEMHKEQLLPLTIIYKDVQALRDHANFLSAKFNFLLDATLGMINIEQNNIIKIFSVAAVIFLPPTLIASIYGMNFHHMPELHWTIGYPLAIMFMLISAWLPFRYFKKKKWL